MTEEFSKGDIVEWSVGNGTTVGTVQKKLTKETTLNGKAVKASVEAPRYLVKNNSTGNITSHRPESLSAQANDNENKLQIGDDVQWNTAQGKTKGTIKEKLTEPIQIKNYNVKASKENPKYLVESDQTGEEAAHRPDALSKV